MFEKLSDMLTSEAFTALTSLLAAISPILAATIAFFTAKHTTRKEFRKLESQWNREDTVWEKESFAEMVAAVSRYTQSGWSRHQREAMEKISVVQTQKNDPRIADLLLAVSSRNRTDALDYLQKLTAFDTNTKTVLLKRTHKKDRK